MLKDTTPSQRIAIEHGGFMLRPRFLELLQKDYRLNVAAIGTAVEENAAMMMRVSELDMESMPPAMRQILTEHDFDGYALFSPGPRSPRGSHSVLMAVSTKNVGMEIALEVEGEIRQPHELLLRLTILNEMSRDLLKLAPHRAPSMRETPTVQDELGTLAELDQRIMGLRQEPDWAAVDRIEHPMNTATDMESILANIARTYGPKARIMLEDSGLTSREAVQRALKAGYVLRVLSVANTMEHMERLAVARRNDAAALQQLRALFAQEDIAVNTVLQPPSHMPRGNILMMTISTKYPITIAVEMAQPVRDHVPVTTHMMELYTLAYKLYTLSPDAYAQLMQDPIPPGTESAVIAALKARIKQAAQMVVEAGGVAPDGLNILRHKNMEYPDVDTRALWTPAAKQPGRSGTPYTVVESKEAQGVFGVGVYLHKDSPQPDFYVPVTGKPDAMTAEAIAHEARGLHMVGKLPAPQNPPPTAGVLLMQLLNIGRPSAALDVQQAPLPARSNPRSMSA